MSKTRGKVRQIDGARKKREKQRAKKRKERRAHWYELEQYFSPDDIRPVRLPEAQGYRTFIHGVIGEIAIVEVDKTMPSEQVVEFGKALGESGIQAFIVSSNVRFLKMRTCTLAESELLDEHDATGTGTVYAPDTRPRPESDGDGDRSAEPEAHAGVVRGGEDDSEGTDAGEVEEDLEEGPADSG